MTTPTTAAFNAPYKTTVAIDCRHIGDDNDYSCFLSTAIEALIVAGQYDIAYRLGLTDPMLVAEESKEDFIKYWVERIARHNNETKY